MIIVRYADDAVIGFQHEYEARKFLRELREQLGKYGLELNEDKTRLIRFGRFARQNRDERGEGKPESFTFLGFQHICAEEQSGAIRSPAHYRRRPTAEETAGDQAGTPSEDARAGGAGRRMAEERAERLLPIPCGSGKSDGAETFPATGRPLLVSCAGHSAAKGGPLGKSWGRYSITGYPCHTLFMTYPDARFRRQPPRGGISEVRTVCGSAASTGLCGGWPVTAIPTATRRRAGPKRWSEFHSDGAVWSRVRETRRGSTSGLGGLPGLCRVKRKGASAEYCLGALQKWSSRDFRASLVRESLERDMGQAEHIQLDTATQGFARG